MENTLKTLKPIEEIISPDDRISKAFHAMVQYRHWAKNTMESYLNDVNHYEAFLLNNDIKPTLKEGNRVERVGAWIKHQYEKEKLAASTINRRVRALSSIFSFYDKVKIVDGNHFKAASAPTMNSGAHSRPLDQEELQKAYNAVDKLKDQGIDISIPFKLLMFTGMRNHAFSYLRVEHINWEEQLITLEYESEDELGNSKKKMQIFPLPPYFLTELKEFIEAKGLEDKDQICYGLRGDKIANKQLNRITDKVSTMCGWKDEQKVTPHGFRYSISMYLEEQGVRHSSIEFILGHTSSKNLKYYLHKQKFAIKELRTAITKLESELEAHLLQTKEGVTNVSTDFNKKPVHSHTNNSSNQSITLEQLLSLKKDHPEAADLLFIQLTQPK